MTGPIQPQREAAAPALAAQGAAAPGPGLPGATVATVPAYLLGSEDALFRDPFADGTPSDR